jgi:hypothetical protein
MAAGRRALCGLWLWLGLALALLLFVPNLVWQAEHGWASLHFASSQNTKTADDTPPATYLAEQLFLGIGIVVAVVGVVWLWRRRPWLRALALVPPVVTFLFLVERGRAYIGWPELADQTASAWRSLPAAERANGAIVARNYAEASALEHYGPSRELPSVLSGHLTWQFWRPAHLPQRYGLFVGFDRDTLRALCAGSGRLATIDNRWHLDNEERGRTIVACRLRLPLGALWRSEITDSTL